jgi:hypothetical protein
VHLGVQNPMWHFVCVNTLQCWYAKYSMFSSVLLSPITGLSLRSVYYGESGERGSSAPGCHRGMGGSVSI